jgi:hypothetical protein
MPIAVTADTHGKMTADFQIHPVTRGLVLVAFVIFLVTILCITSRLEAVTGLRLQPESVQALLLQHNAVHSQQAMVLSLLKHHKMLLTATVHHIPTLVNSGLQ